MYYLLFFDFSYSKTSVRTWKELMKNGIILFMSIIMCMESFTLGWSLTKSAQILGWLSLHIKTKFQNYTKTKPRKIFTTSCHHLSLATFSQVRYTIKKQTRTKNVLWINKNLKDITLRQKIHWNHFSRNIFS